MAEAFHDGVRLWYEMAGSAAGAPVVLIPGLGMAGATWQPVRERLAPRHPVIAIDPRGSGQSDAPAGPYTGELMACDVAAVLDAEGVTRAHVVGMSMGGMIAQEVALRMPERVRSLVLISTYAAPDEWALRALSLRRRVLHGLGFRDQFALGVLLVFSPRTLRTAPALVSGLEERILADPPAADAYLSQLDFCLAHDARDRLAGLQAPALVLVGEEDALTTRWVARDLAALIPGAALEEVPETSHALIWEAPQAVAEVVDRFVSGVVGAVA
jgi:pimeloyl-ACP methyl ester carboxylesterase